MPRKATAEFREEDGWLIDASNNRASLSYWGGRAEAETSLRSLKNCRDCVNCSYCSNCSGCSYCSFLYKSGALAIPIIPAIHMAVYAAVSQPNALDMGSWHTCETTHCRAGWVVHLAGEVGKKLEEFHNTELAAMLIYRESGYPINPGRFHDSNKAALADMARLAGVEA